MINGDNVAGIWKRLAYFPQCLMNHMRGESSAVAIRQVELKQANLGKFGRGSPSRIVCNMLWSEIDFRAISKSFDEPLHFFDIGCGKGEYGLYMQELSQKFFGSYVGLDMYKADSFPDNFEHILSDAANAANAISSNVNFIMSQSALEHIEHDSMTIESVTNKLLLNKRKFIQVHMVPAPSSLWLYLWHGWRQYSKKSLSKLVSKSIRNNDDLNVFAIPICGPSCFKTHFFRITIFSYILILRGKRKEKSWESFPLVHEKIEIAVKNDLKAKSIKNNAFWAVVIASKGCDLGVEWQ